MASETTTTSANDIYLAAQVDSVVLPELRPQNVSKPLLRYAKLTQSTAHDFPILDDPGGAAAGTEGTDNSNTQLTTSKATATSGTVVLMATVTDELSAISIVDAIPTFGAQLQRSVDEKFETDACALHDSFSNTTSTSGVDANVDWFLQGKAALVARDIPGTYVSVLHPVQTSDIGRDAASSTAAMWGNSSVNVAGMNAAGMSGFQFELAGIPVYQTSLVKTANSSADRAGAIFAANQALGVAETWGPRIELERDASLPGTEVVATSNYGVIEIRNDDGQTMISDA